LFKEKNYCEPIIAYHNLIKQ